MNRKIVVTAVIFFLFAGCSSDKVDLSDPLLSGRGFIEANLKGDYAMARNYMVSDSTNDQLLDGLRDTNKKMSKEEREAYREADIIIDSTHSPNDSTDIIYYKNTYKNEPTKLKIIKQGEDWKVDFKYTFWENR